MTPAPALAVLYQDADVVVIDKPAGVPVVPAPTDAATGCVRHHLERQLGEPLWVVHRLDRQTSGVLAFARHAEAHRRLNESFEHRLVHKTYLALVAGLPDPAFGIIDIALHPARKGRMRPATTDEAGLAAQTDYDVRRVWVSGASTAALVEARPRTGRHHQIRVHLRALGTPVLFDDVYGRATREGPWRGGPCQRLTLHAASLKWPGSDGGSLPGHRVDAPLAADLAALVAWFDTNWEAQPGQWSARATSSETTSWLP